MPGALKNISVYVETDHYGLETFEPNEAMVVSGKYCLSEMVKDTMNE